MTRDELVALMLREGIGRAEEIAALAMPCAMMMTRPASGPDRKRLASRTRLGGLPDLSPDSGWPRSSEGRLLAFVGQLDLADLDKTPIAGELPRRGLLAWFFEYDATMLTKPPEFAMTFSEDATSASRQPPESLHVFPECEMALRFTWSFPRGGFDCPFLHELGLDDQERWTFRDFKDTWSWDHMPRGHQLLGYASALTDPYVGTALAKDRALHEKWFARPPEARVALTDEVAATARRFRLCAEFCEDQVAEMDWGDGARLSFLVRRDAWEAGTFGCRCPTDSADIWCES